MKHDVGHPLPGSAIMAGAAAGLGRTRSGTQSRWRHALAITGLLLVAGSFHLSRLDRGWRPYDEGTLAHAAERVVLGELPHRDFDDVYTGGLALLNAAGFKLFGTSLLTPRYLLFGLYLATIPAVYYLASRLLRPAGAVLASAAALVGNVPVYTAAMPSWYNLLLALLGAAALVRHSETGRSRWIFAAGFLAGISISMKITGLYFIAGALLWLLFCAQEHARLHAPRSANGALLMHIGGLGVFGALVFALLLPRVTPAELLYFFGPVAAVLALLIRRELQLRSAGYSTPTPYREAVVLAAGVALPLAVLVAPYFVSGSIDALLQGALLGPTGRISEAAIRPPGPATIGAAVPLAAVIYVIVRYGRLPRSALIPIALVLVGAFALSSDAAVFATVVAAMRWTPVVASFAGAAALWNTRFRQVGRPGERQHRSLRRRRRALYLLTALTAIVSLMQYPFAHPIYLWYVMPIAVLALAGVIGVRSTERPHALAAFALFFIAFNVQQILRMPSTARLAIERAPLHVTPADKAKYERAVALLHKHAEGEYIWAGPDTPELYYLAGRRNPTRHLFEFLAQQGEAEADILAGIERHGVRAISINTDRYFSSLSDETKAELRHRFPAVERVGNLEVRWRP